MGEINNGRRQAYEVSKPLFKTAERDGRPESDAYAGRIIAGTLWDKSEAKKYAKACGVKRQKIGVIVVGDEAFYSIEEDGVPIEMITDTAEEASALHLLNINSGSQLPIVDEIDLPHEYNIDYNKINVNNSEKLLAEYFSKTATLEPVEA